MLEQDAVTPHSNSTGTCRDSETAVIRVRDVNELCDASTALKNDESNSTNNDCNPAEPCSVVASSNGNEIMDNSQNSQEGNKKKRKLPAWFLETSASTSLQNDENSQDKRQKVDSNSNSTSIHNDCNSGEPGVNNSIEKSKNESNENDNESNTSNSASISATNDNDDHENEVKPEIKIKKEIKTEPGYNTNTTSSCVVKEEASSTTATRESCQYGITCYRRNPMHRIEMAHPGDIDYKRPNYPQPPVGTPNCPYGDRCYRRNPIHFQCYSHPPTTDFKKNRRERKKIKKEKQAEQNKTRQTKTRKNTRNEQNSENDADFEDDDFDEDEDDPFATNSSDDEYLPTDDEYSSSESENDADNEAE